jgi:DNA-binding IclR family transcriptional regulator
MQAAEHISANQVIKILGLLREHPDCAYSAAAVSDQIGCPLREAEIALELLADSRLVERHPDDQPSYHVPHSLA